MDDQFLTRMIISVNHLLLADDCYLFFKVDVHSSRAIKILLTGYCQRINFEK